jgi:predicted permease
MLAMVLGLPAIVLRVAAAFTQDSKPMNITVIGLTALFMGFLIWNLLHDLGKGDRPTSERIFGALCAYVFIGLLFALIYAHMEFRQPGSFATSQAFFADNALQESNLFPLFMYFSFVTLSTLGYGDITPIAEHARTLAWFEALVGQLYLAVMVAGLVATHISENMRKNRGEPPSEE